MSPGLIKPFQQNRFRFGCELDLLYFYWCNSKEGSVEAELARSDTHILDRQRRLHYDTVVGLLLNVVIRVVRVGERHRFELVHFVVDRPEHGRLPADVPTPRTKH